ncbi:MAG: AMP-binding protein, partial [Candidatus Omnitrophica bacterium]|nr:AMP-binding protein [Candidatus Omnitrophota bacterium]
MPDPLSNPEHITVENLLHENRLFKADPTFFKNAIVKDEGIYKKASENSEKYWVQHAEQLHWYKKWNKVLDWNPPFAKWFINGKLNACDNCLDRHIKAGLGKKTAILWEGEPGDQRRLTYDDVYKAVNKLANGYKKLGVGKGDRVAIYMPMVPEAMFAMLACARLGAIHTVIFGGFSYESLKGRIMDADAKLLVTADGGWRRGKIVPLKETSDQAAEECPGLKNIIVLKRTENAVSMKSGRDIWYHDLIKDVADFCEPEPMDAEDVLFILYTSGTTGKPKGIVHTTGGYMTGAMSTTKMVFDLHDDDVFWCTADVGWVTGHTYMVYGPMSNA